MREPSFCTSMTSPAMRSSPVPTSNSSHSRMLRPGRTIAFHTRGATRWSRSSSTFPPDSLRLPYSRAGNTRLSLNTIKSPGRRYSTISRNARCSIGPPDLGTTINREPSRGSAGVCAISASGRW